MKSRRAAGPRLWPVAALAALLLGVSFAVPPALARAGPARRPAGLPGLRRPDAGRAPSLPRLLGRVPARGAARVPRAVVPAVELRRLVRGADGDLRRRLPRRRSADPALGRRLARARARPRCSSSASRRSRSGRSSTRASTSGPRCSRSPRWPRSSTTGRSSRAGSAGSRSRRSSGRAALAPLGLAYLWRRRGPRATGGGRRGVRRRRRGLLPAVRGARPGRRLAQRRRSARPAAPGGEPRRRPADRGGASRRAPRSRRSRATARRR